jgi:Protein of unknown function (DUF998)
MTPEITKQQGRTDSLLTTWLASACLLGNGCFTVIVLALHALQPELSPYNEAVSYYVHGAHGWLLTVGLLSWGFGSVALLLGLTRTVRTRVGNAGLWGLALWSVGVIFGGLFRADPPGQWDKPPSMAGLIHGNAALIAFIALPIAAFLLSRGIRRAPEWRAVTGILYALAITTAVSLIAFFASLLPVFISPGPPMLLGLTERILLIAYVAWLCVAAIGLLRSSDNRFSMDRM